MIDWEPEFQTSLPVRFFFFDKELGLERWLPPRAFVLGVDLSALILGPSFFLVFAYLVLQLRHGPAGNLFGGIEMSQTSFSQQAAPVERLGGDHEHSCEFLVQFFEPMLFCCSS